MRCEPNLLWPLHITWPTPAQAGEEGGARARARAPLASPIQYLWLVSCLSLPLKQRSQAESVNTEREIARMGFVVDNL